ncbi:MAG: hypothetical protein WC437_03010 [Patescibacteria group bacterium]
MTKGSWIPAFAGMTREERDDEKKDPSTTLRMTERGLSSRESMTRGDLEIAS